jgi:dihydroorotase
MNVLLKSATIIDIKSPFNGKVKDVLIENGKISKIGTKIIAPSSCKEIILDNLHISCGWFDTSVSFGEPGFEERETIVNGLKTAAKSGFTAVALNSNSNPYIDNKSIVEFLKGAAKNNVVELYPIASLTKQSEGNEIAELYDMQNSGAIAFGDYNKSVSNANLMKIALQYAQNFNGLVLSFPQDDSISNNGIANESNMSTKLGLKGNPSLAEELQIARDIFLLEYTGGRLHIPTISTVTSVKLIREAKKRKLDLTCGVAAHHLALTDDELSTFDSNYKTSPPLRTQKDLNALIKGVKDGTIDMINSDHNPIDIENKKVEFENALEGTIGLESLFGAVNKVIDLEHTVNCLTYNPRKRFNLKELSIKVGEKANITLFNPDFTYEFTKEYITSTSKNSAFLNKELKGKAYGIFTNNKLIIS